MEYHFASPSEVKLFEVRMISAVQGNQRGLFGTGQVTIDVLGNTLILQ